MGRSGRDRHRQVAVGARGGRAGARRSPAPSCRSATGPAKAGEMPAVIVDPSRARAAGWAPRYGFADGHRGGLGGVVAGRDRRGRSRPDEHRCRPSQLRAEAELAKLDPDERGAAARVPRRPSARRRRAAGGRDPGLQRGADRRRGDRRDPRRGGRPRDRGDRRRRRRQGRDGRRGARRRVRWSATCRSTAARARRCGSATGWPAPAARR